VREATDALKISLWSAETAAAHVALGEAYLQAKDAAAARSEAERALVLEPQSADARRLIDRLAPR
jgi:Tfp pilus assembly protein PilF